jgi:type II restriction/modification system DNA methylase subunit YeeA
LKSQTIDFYLKSPKDTLFQVLDGMKQIKLDPIYFEYDKVNTENSESTFLDKV